MGRMWVYWFLNNYNKVFLKKRRKYYFASNFRHFISVHGGQYHGQGPVVRLSIVEGKILETKVIMPWYLDSSE